MIKREKRKKLKIKLLKSSVSFVCIGIAGAALDFILYFVFNDLLTVPYALSQIASYTVVALSKYLILKLIRYGGAFDVFVTEAPRFIVVSIITLAVSTALIAFLSAVIHSDIIVKLIVLVVTTIMNMFSYRFVVFADGEPKASAFDKLLNRLFSRH